MNQVFSLLLAFLFTSIGFTSFSQTEAQSNLLDEGFAGIHVLSDFEEISDRFVKTDYTNLWFDNVEDSYALDRYVCEGENMFPTKFFGLTVDRLEIKTYWASNWEAENEEDEEYVGVRTFHLFIKLPSGSDYVDFASKIAEAYGPIRTYEINPVNLAETPNWFTSTTMMTFSNFEEPFIAPNGDEYIHVKFRAAFG